MSAHGIGNREVPAGTAVRRGTV